MRIAVHQRRSVFWPAVVWAAAALVATAVSAPASRSHHHSARHSKRHISAQEARAARAKRAQLSRRLRGLRSAMHAARAKVHEARAREQGVQEDINTVQARIARVRGRLRTVNARLGFLANEHVKVVVRMDRTQQRLEKRRLLLAGRIRDNYERGQMTYAQVLLESRSVHELLSRGYYVRQIVQSDAELVKGIQQDLRQIEADKRSLEAQQREQRALAAEFEAQKQQLGADLAREQEVLKQADEAKQEAEEELDNLDSESSDITNRIRAYEEIEARQIQEEREAALYRRHHPEERSGEIVRSPEMPVWTGGFLRPVPGGISSGFGYRYHPILHTRRLHTGVDMRASYGTPIRAAGAGRVMIAGYMRGYGNCVIISHGNGVSTLYGHCSDLVVSEGQTVQAGEVIAHVGATGMATGPHLHFEVRHHGVPVRPF